MTFPHGIDAAYIKAVSPKGFLRYWFRSLDSTKSVNLTVKVSVKKDSAEKGSLEKFDAVYGISSKSLHMLENYLFLPDLSTIDFDELL